MEALKSYLLTAMAASVAASALLRITDQRYRAYLRYVAGLCLLLVLIHPLFGLAGKLSGALSDLDGVTQPEVTAEQTALGEIGREMSRQIGDLIARRFSLPREAISVKLTLDLTDLSAIAIHRVELTVLTPCDANAIRLYLESSLDCEAAVTQVKGAVE